jgi:hypothetical protein
MYPIEPQEIVDLIVAKRDDHYRDSRVMLRKVGGWSNIYQKAEARWILLDDVLLGIENLGGPGRPPLPDNVDEWVDEVLGA